MLAVVAGAALVMGLPTLRGSFVGGDDHRLVLDHVLVNHPSPAHAVELFKIVHRDLYQPLPLLSFQAEFALAGMLGLFDEGLAGGEWLFHLTNVLLHITNAVLVWVLIQALHRPQDRRGALAVATIAAVLFAIHPLEVEVVAWVNGRMMLLSTLFALASLVALATWLRDGRSRWAILTAVLVALCAMSKIRVGLPLLLVIVFLARRRKVTLRFVGLWAVCAAITAAFAVVNYHATAKAGMFSGAAENLHGPKAARALLALAWYFQHFVWPTGLASWYPTPGVVSWSDPATVRAVAIVACAVAIFCWSALRWRSAVWGFTWFVVTIASTVQLVPTRNALAADRYMYLPIIGLLWYVSMVLYKAYEHGCHRWTRSRVGLVAALAGVVLAGAMIGQSWHVASFYETPTDKSRRIAELNPQTPHVWERVAWSYHKAEKYAEAIEFARREFVHEDGSVLSEAHQVIGLSQFRLGEPDAAFESLQRAIDANPSSSMARYQLAKVLDEVGRTEEALSLYEQSVANAPLANPRLLRLASLYRRLGRPADARRMYEQTLRNNPYDVKATMSLAELDIESGTDEAYRAAVKTLTTMLEWMPENADAWVNLGVARSALGQTGQAIEAYRKVLAQDPGHVTAALNLAAIYHSSGDVRRAAPLFELAARSGLTSVEEIATVHDFYVSQGKPERAVEVWDEFLARFPDSVDGQAYAAWSRVLAGRLEPARTGAKTLARASPPHPLALATLAAVALIEGRYADAMEQADALCASGDGGAHARRRLLGMLEAFGERNPNVAWTYCLAAELLIADGQLNGARVGADLCERHCSQPTCHERVRRLRARLADDDPTAGAALIPNAP